MKLYSGLLTEFSADGGRESFSIITTQRVRPRPPTHHVIKRIRNFRCRCFLQREQFDSLTERVDDSENISVAVQIRLTEHNCVKRIFRERPTLDASRSLLQPFFRRLELLTYHAAITVTLHFIFRCLILCPRREIAGALYSGPSGRNRWMTLVVNSLNYSAVGVKSFCRSSCLLKVICIGLTF